MKSSSTKQTIKELLGAPVHFGRPHTPDDEGWIEAFIKTLKYHRDAPRSFKLVDDIVQWLTRVPDIYNNDPHSSLTFLRQFAYRFFSFSTRPPERHILWHYILISSANSTIRRLRSPENRRQGNADRLKHFPAAAFHTATNRDLFLVVLNRRLLKRLEVVLDILPLKTMS